MLELTERVLTKFGFTQYEIKLSTRPEKAVGSDEIWEQACTCYVLAMHVPCYAHTMHMPCTWTGSSGRPDET